MIDIENVPWDDVRRRWINTAVAPVVKAYAIHSELDIVGAAFYVAQYWDDEAADAVHDKLVFFTEMPDDLTAEAIADRVGDMYDDERRWNRETDEYEPFDATNAIGYIPSGYSFDKEKYGYSGGGHPWYDFDDNGWAIPLWGAHAHEGSQDSAWHENYTPVWRFDVTGTSQRTPQGERRRWGVKVTGQPLFTPGRGGWMPEYTDDTEWLEEFAQAYF